MNNVTQCHNVLVGRNTPVGEYVLQKKNVKARGYGGDILQFKETKDSIYAIHRVWLLSPKQHRLERIQSDNASARVGITGGCINVMPEVYDKLVNDYQGKSLKIVE